MKKLFIFIFLTILSINSEAQRTKYPIVDKTKVKDAVIESIDLTSKETIIYLKVFMKDGYWVAINKKCHIEFYDPKTGYSEALPILQLANIYNPLSFNTKYTYLPDNLLILIFPPLPKGVDKINLIEDKGWKWYSISLNPRQEIIVERIATTTSEVDSLIENSKSPYAGIYEQLIPMRGSPNPYKLAFVSKEDSSYLVYLGSDKPNDMWKYGEVKAVLRPTAAKSIFKADWYMNDKLPATAIITMDGGLMKIHVTYNEVSSDIDLVRMAGDKNNPNYYDSNNPQERWSGTGFALADGYIVTNNHVVDKAAQIEIFGINGDFIKGYKAKVIGKDKVSDLALLKIEDSSILSTLITPPYSVNFSMADVGENTFALGYPMIGTMGEEVKLTNGIISSRSGYEGDVTNYQISVPIQPGNSGGPMFNENGEIIGIICAKHTAAENVGYSIKTSYLKNLIESVARISIIPKHNTLEGKELKDQVKEIRNFVYLIKCSK